MQFDQAPQLPEITQADIERELGNKSILIMQLRKLIAQLSEEIENLKAQMANPQQPEG